MNRHNLHYWSVENPTWNENRNFQSLFSVNVCCGAIGHHLIGLHFFRGTLNSTIYLDFLQNRLPLLLDVAPLETRRRMWFQQDGAPPHNVRIVTEHLNERYSNRWIGRFGSVHWPTRSPDLSPLDFSVWDILQSYVYEVQLRTLEELQDRIQAACGYFARTTLLKMCNQE
ncbi:DDE 3 domain containing protein [Asbolus verrucosus]|uniref:DDE 3 domain containing protein n=1 Tax=Asbolus verrucosus TaxID=1661398 RepID=A0A482WBR1_ASBVE|nr:DDE 3 domain containing protein [Asbolus verrucosus]